MAYSGIERTMPPSSVTIPMNSMNAKLTGILPRHHLFRLGDPGILLNLRNPALQSLESSIEGHVIPSRRVTECGNFAFQRFHCRGKFALSLNLLIPQSLHLLPRASTNYR